MRVCLFLDGEYPTAKAYGVTTFNTMKELVGAGHKVTLVCKAPKNEGTYEQIAGSEMVYFPTTRLTIVLDSISRKSFKLHSKVAWKILTILNHRSVQDLVIRIKPDLIWTREEPAPQNIIRNFKGVNVIEIHQKLSIHRTRRIMKLAPYSQILCPISIPLRKSLEREFLNTKILFSPMGIVPESKSDQELRIEITSHYLPVAPILEIGYFGKLAPTGHSKGFEDLLELGLALRDIQAKFKLRFVGVGKGEFEILTKALKYYDFHTSEVEVTSHQQHASAIQIMKECDFLILPSNRDPNYVGFPLKALEYISSGRAVLAARTDVNTHVFEGDFQPFWYESGEFEKLAKTLVSLRRDEEFFDYLLSGIQFARGYSWESRTGNIINEVSASLESLKLPK
jgi:glycosyltransferase involved in cell wall biosynthesis